MHVVLPAAIHNIEPTLRFFNHLSGTVGQDSISPFSGIYVNLTQQLQNTQSHNLQVKAQKIQTSNT